MASLPEDIVIEILSRLPVKSLIRFRVVCKIWYDLVRSPNFISKHLKNYNINHSHLVFKRDDDQTWNMFLDEKLENNLSYQNLNDAVPMDHLIIRDYNDGLFCLSRRSTRFFLWNPAAKEIRMLPRCRPHDIYLPEVGFGFNHIKNDFELVLIAKLKDEEIDLSDEDNEYNIRTLYQFVGVYTLSTNSWREFETDEITCYSTLGSLVYLNGFIYFVGHSGLEFYKMIISFDMSGDKFQEIQPPRPHTADSSRFVIDLLNDALTLLFSDYMENCFQLWVLMKIDDGNCWKHTLNVVIGQYIHQLSWMPIGFWKDDGFVLQSKKGQLLLYDTTTQEIKDLGLQARTFGSACSYKENPINVMIDLSDDFDIPWHILGVS